MSRVNDIYYLMREYKVLLWQALSQDEFHIANQHRLGTNVTKLLGNHHQSISDT